MTWAALLDSYLTECWHRSQSEVAAYEKRRILRHMLAALEPKTATPLELHSWAYGPGRRGRPSGSSVVMNRITHASGFFGFLVRLGVLEHNPTAQLKRPIVRSKREPRGITTEEIHRLLGVLDLSRPVGLRDLAMIRLQIQTGLRRKAIVSLTGASLSRRDGQVWFRAREKGNVTREGELPQDVAQALDRYLATRNRTLATLRPHEPLFWGRGGPYRAHSWQVRLKGLAARAGVRLVGTHCLRHSGAQLLLDVGASIADVRDFLGHRSIRTTEIYLRRRGQPNRYAGKVAELLKRP